ncbi:MAG TPA: Rne/Rng family ribonuclease [Planctomycetaceae bacterium]|nr:Rne/Rng family ribonuclease [Planctomycetaceae bacterium]
MKKEMLVNVLQPEESRIAILEDGVLEELYVERNNAENYVGNIYKGRVVNLEPSIQAAFVDFGVGRNGFLHVSDVEYEYYKHLLPESQQRELDGNPGDRKTRSPKFNERSVRNKPSIQDIFKRGSEVLVQVIKEGLGSKGPTLSTYISIPGRYVVLMPALQRVGVSRKINDDEVRRSLRSALKELSPPEGLGFIIRTAGHNRTRKDLQRDLNYLLRLWRTIVRRLKKHSAPIDIYEESDMITRTIRDIYDGEIDTIWIDEPKAFERAREFMKIVLPRQVHRIKFYEGHEPIFSQYGIEKEILKIQDKRVPLPGGGSLIIEQTEALVAIDVNSGTFRIEDKAEETAFQVNMKAAAEIARQIRLRDLGGVIVNDFIDMREERHRRQVENMLRDSVKRDRARTKILRISPFGLIEMTRQRIRPSFRRSVYTDCPCCQGVGQVKTSESVAIETIRLLISAAHRESCVRVIIEVHQQVADYLNNRKRKEITRIEEESNISVQILARNDVGPEHMDIRSINEAGTESKITMLSGSK